MRTSAAARPTQSPTTLEINSQGLHPRPLALTRIKTDMNPAQRQVSVMKFRTGNVSECGVRRTGVQLRGRGGVVTHLAAATTTGCPSC